MTQFGLLLGFIYTGDEVTGFTVSHPIYIRVCTQGNRTLAKSVHTNFIFGWYRWLKVDFRESSVWFEV